MIVKLMNHFFCLSVIFQDGGGTSWVNVPTQLKLSVTQPVPVCLVMSHFLLIDLLYLLLISRRATIPCDMGQCSDSSKMAFDLISSELP